MANKKESAEEVRNEDGGGAPVTCGIWKIWPASAGPFAMMRRRCREEPRDTPRSRETGKSTPRLRPALAHQSWNGLSEEISTSTILVVFSSKTELITLIPVNQDRHVEEDPMK